MEGKICTGCGAHKPLSEYQRNKNTKDGYKYRCKECQHAYDRAHITEAAAIKRRQVASEWNKANRELLAERYRTDPVRREKQRASSRRYSRLHPFKGRVAQYRFRAALDEPGTFSEGEWIALLASYNGRCLCCGTTENICVDHIVPLGRGGMNTIDNVQPLCRSCNASKGTKTIDYRPDKKAA